ncbi:MAG: hypothetical protein ACI9DJ_003210 [Algoriphagus sp.]
MTAENNIISIGLNIKSGGSAFGFFVFGLSIIEVNTSNIIFIVEKLLMLRKLFLVLGISCEKEDSVFVFQVEEDLERILDRFYMEAE